MLVDIEKITVKAAFQIKTRLNWAPPTIDLGQACNARWHLMACIIKHKVPGEILIVSRCMRARADKRHITADDVEKLR
ncbi:hypothetical protein TH468_06070 [Thalassospira sp. MCCC 1A03138]|nr:hypothetical protein TH468_06070 [Thalassospira sp. MCCC 1A03138]